MRLTDKKQDSSTQSLHKLKEKLLHTWDLIDLKQNDFITPFIEVIRSKETTESVTSAALTSVDKFISYGLIGSCDISVRDEVLVPQRTSSPVLLLNTTRKEHFIGSAKTVILENTILKNSKKGIERTTLPDTSSHSQSEKIYCELDSAILNLVIGVRPDSHSNDGAGEEKTVEKPKEIKKALKEAFAIDVQQNSSVEKNLPIESTLNRSCFLESSTIANLDSLVDMICTAEKEKADSSSHHSWQKWEEYINPNDVRFMPCDGKKDDEVLHVPHKMICVQELFLFLISLCNPNEKQNTEDNIRISLRLLIVALEVGADTIGSYDSLLSLVKDDLCRNFISLLLSENLENFAANLQLAFLVFESLRSHLKFQMEAYLVKLASLTTNTNSNEIPYEKREVALESLLQFWRIPGFLMELYVNYDCDLYCSNMFEALTDLFSKNAYPVSDIRNTNVLSLSALLSVLNSIESNYCHRVESESKPMGFNGDGKRPILGAFHEEIVMPAEQTGIVRENYLWKVLLRRGASKEGTYIHTPVGLFDYALFTLIHHKIFAALCLVFDQSDHPFTHELAISGFKKCAMIYAHYSMTNDFDSLVISLSKFTTLLSSSGSMDMLAVSFGESLKAQLAAKTVFDLAYCHGNILQDGWKNVLDCIIILFKCKLLPKEIVMALIYASHCQGKTYDEDSTVFILELLLKVVIQNKNRVRSIWKEVCDHIYCLLMAASVGNCCFMLERSVVGLLRLAKVLMRVEDMRPLVLQSLHMLLLLKPQILYHVSRQIAYGLFEVLEASAENIYSDSDWSIIFILLECVGAGAHPLLIVGEAEKAESGTGLQPPHLISIKYI
ncbi:hypothetical protein J437_LFUL005754 [Ladona fulva]|uniref:Mon2/Sec7/BIG1-like HUS domain-containing protein n=1 Tax=Ladona fulva TaxID=123851 RepID=A0A8K0K1P6_LADFU|nr:hypothetical protein J437_LFUL005754 [Ladona fulva]